MNKKSRIGVIYGGKSGEHDVSISTAFSVINAIDKELYEVHPFYISQDGVWCQWKVITKSVSHENELRFSPSASLFPQVFNFKQFLDVVFPLVHGPNGEDGTLQGLLEMANVPYVGSGVLSSSVGMDKVFMKHIFAQFGLPQVKFLSFLYYQIEMSIEKVCDEIEAKLGYPCFVKPANLGSSVGISKAKDRDALLSALNLAIRFDTKVIVEESVNAREVEVAVLGNRFPKASVVGEIVPESEFYDFESKYKSRNTKLLIPSPVSEAVSEQVRTLAIRAFQSLECFGLSRLDFFYIEDTGEIFINEINTLPGFTPYSMYPMLWEKSGLSYQELIDKLIYFAFERQKEKERINQSPIESL